VLLGRPRQNRLTVVEIERHWHLRFVASIVRRRYAVKTKRAGCITLKAGLYPDLCVVRRNCIQEQPDTLNIAIRRVSSGLRMQYYESDEWCWIAVAIQRRGRRA